MRNRDRVNRRGVGAPAGVAPPVNNWQGLFGLNALIEQEWDYVKRNASQIAIWTLKFWSIVFIGISWIVGLITLATFFYLLFYHYMIPTHHTKVPVHFDFSGATTMPLATVYLQGDKQWRYTELGELNEELTREQDRSRYFSAGHAYNAYLDLEFPDSEVNAGVGMISIEMAAYHNQSTLLATSLQSFLPQYTSPLVRWMWSWTWAIPLVTGLLQEKQTLTLHFFDALIEQENAPISEIKIALKSANAFKFQLYQATLRLQVQLYGIRYFMYHWPLSTAAIIISLIFSFELFWSAVFLLVIGFWCCSFSNANGVDDEAVGENHNGEGQGYAGVPHAAWGDGPSPRDADENEADVFVGPAAQRWIEEGFRGVDYGEGEDDDDEGPFFLRQDEEGEEVEAGAPIEGRQAAKASLPSKSTAVSSSASAVRQHRTKKQHQSERQHSSRHHGHAPHKASVLPSASVTSSSSSVGIATVSANLSPSAALVDDDESEAGEIVDELEAHPLDLSAQVAQDPSVMSPENDANVAQSNPISSLRQRMPRNQPAVALPGSQPPAKDV